ncbi:MAG: Fe-S cluster assembly ATPase SufC [bacterium]|nr:Fe-S cluster assembly ATPase SufC [bacterium]
MPTITNTLEIHSLHAKAPGQEILRGVDVSFPRGKIVTLMGPNGSGKSTLAHVLMGQPEFTVTKGQIRWQGKNLLRLKAWERSRLGLFVSFQQPPELPGVNLLEFLATAYKAHHPKANQQKDFDKNLRKALSTLKLPESFLERSVNTGFSGGEKKKAEMLQLLVLQPKLAILDEVDSGLDIDALKLISKTVRSLRSPQRTFIIITHYQRLLQYLKPDIVHVLVNGVIAESGSAALVKKIEKKGYSEYLKVAS